jgi:ribonuclease J
MKFKIHRGTHEIGGSCVEIESRNSRIIVDIGMPLYDRKGKHFEIRDLENKPGPELVKNKILPDIDGFYEWDKSNNPVNGLLLSHAHIDHFGFLRYLRKDICCYLGEATKRLIDITSLFTPYKGNIQNYQPINSYIPFTCNKFRITPFLMDHSAFDSYAFLIEADDKKLIYSGDFREHGRKPGALQRFLKLASENIDAILLEGTMFGRDDGEVKTERAIEEEIVRVINASKAIILMYFSGQNIDRLVSFYRAAIKTNKLFVIDVYTANILEALKEFAAIPFPSDRYNNIRVFFPYWLCKRIPREGNTDLLEKFRKYQITKEEISLKSTEIMLLVRTSMLNDFEQINNIHGATFIYSMWKGYLNEKPMDKLNDFIKKHKMTFYSIHTSGHSYINALKKVIQKLKPKYIFPIHTFHPNKYKILGNNIVVLADVESFEL